jgi:uncharacterized protein YegP (UPF0339 family)
MPAKFELKKSKRGRYMWNLLASNGEAILTSQQYKSKSGAKKGISSVRGSASDGSRFERRKAKNGKGYFVLKAGNGKVVGQSEMYNSNRALENGIKSVQKNAPKAATKDQS